jgi:acyl carrier protein
MSEITIPVITTISQKISDFIVANYLFGNLSKLPDQSDSLIETGVIDSTGILELIEFLESEFGIEVKENETIPQNLDGIASLTHYVAEKLSKGA